MNKNTFIGIILLLFYCEFSICQTTKINKTKIYLPLVEINNSLKSVLDDIIDKEKKCFPSERYLYIGIREYGDEFNYIFIGEIEPSKELFEIFNKMPLACFQYKEITGLITYCESKHKELPSTLFLYTNRKQSFTLPVVNQEATYINDYIPSHWSYITFDNYKSLTIETEYYRCK